jgi:uncharacterized metal-binding protein YceD (DUF177 family)
MSEQHDPAPLPFRAPVRVADLPRGEETPVSLVPDAAERAALARFLGVAAVHAAALNGTLSPWRARGWRLAARVEAEVEQACVVTLEPVRRALSLEVGRRWLPAAELGPEPEDGAEITADAEEAPEPLGAEIDLAEVLVEALALAIDPYPRAEGAEFEGKIVGPPGAEALTDEAARPFAGLAELKRRGGGG